MKNRDEFEAMLKGMEFERDLVKMMMNHPDFSEVAHGKMIGNTSVVPDIQAIYQERNMILVECKV